MLEQLNRLENSVPKQDLGNNTQRRWRRETEKPVILQLTEFYCPNKRLNDTFFYSKNSALSLFNNKPNVFPYYLHLPKNVCSSSLYLLSKLRHQASVLSPSPSSGQQPRVPTLTYWYTTSIHDDFRESCLSTALLKILTCIHIGTWNMWAIKVLESLVYNLTTATL